MRRGRAFREALMSVATVALVLLVLVSIDDRVRNELSLRFMSNPSHGLAAAGHQARTLTAVVAEAARDQSLAHAPLLVFSLAATVLVLFMLRT
jgi:hypothetical protein